MGLIKSKGNMYTWITDEWNPVKGKCSHDCSYCYMKRWGKQNPVHICDSEFKVDLGKDKTIFVVSGSDLFASDIPDEWIIRTLKYCDRFNNTYLFQTKNPKRISLFSEFPARSLFCTTIETNRNYPQMGNSPFIEERVMGMNQISEYPKYVTIEPIMDFDLKELVNHIKMCYPQQVNIGADSGNNHLPEPSKEKLLELIDELKKFTVIDQKRNLDRLLK